MAVLRQSSYVVNSKATFTLDDYVVVADEGAKELQAICAPMLPKNMRYSIPWLARSKITMEMRQHKVTSLTYSGEERVELLVAAFPDQKDWRSNVVLGSARYSLNKNQILCA